ncbi:hypothetical protein FDP41_005498 [Naegleria fowleri]|uniref:Protein kinase domain-containing protein n=1 Tax=Naegleria fowleri TaxID=5763 RepID=A0A6A5BN60_NAEFO|nr:uncharacterized protein FDP41_005498 [Naegleria fowleri]KAF0975504.1 hypothetical protein FDP41_005498 [Naegleria fowleri]CAG4709905.1 unnamed protein product [Naegleria fowleri]
MPPIIHSFPREGQKFTGLAIGCCCNNKSDSDPSTFMPLIQIVRRTNQMNDLSHKCCSVPNHHEKHHSDEEDQTVVVSFMNIEILKKLEFNLFEISIQDIHPNDHELDHSISSSSSIYILKFSRDVEREFKCFQLMYSKYGFEYIPQFYMIENRTSHTSKWKAIATRKSNSPLNLEKTLCHSLNEGVMMAKRVFEIVKAMHDCHLVHNDIKPDNFLIDSHDGKLKIIDFDMSLIITDRSMKPSIFCGDRLYRSPHKMTQLPANVNDETYRKHLYQSDLYNCGLVMALFILGPQIQSSLKQTIRGDKHFLLHQLIPRLMGELRENIDSPPMSAYNFDHDLFHTITSLLMI